MSHQIRGASIQEHDPQLESRLAVAMSGYHIHGSLYTYNTESQTVTVTSAGTYYALTGWTGIMKETGAGYLVGHAANGTITVGAKAAGRYRICYRGSVMAVTTDRLGHFRLYKDSTAIVGARSTAMFSSTANTWREIVVVGIEDLDPTNVITVKVSSPSAGQVFNIYNASLEMIWIAGA